MAVGEVWGMRSRSMNGQRNAGGCVGRGLAATTVGVAAMSARAERTAGEGKRGGCGCGWRTTLLSRACFGLAMIRESTEDVPRES